MADPKGKPEPRVPKADSRRPYRTPRLVDYGPIARLAAGGSGAQLETVMNMSATRRP